MLFKRQEKYIIYKMLTFTFPEKDTSYNLLKIKIKKIKMFLLIQIDYIHEYTKNIGHATHRKFKSYYLI